MIDKSQVVVIHRKKSGYIRRGEGDDPAYYKRKIGSMLNGHMCLTEEEIKQFLPDIIGVSASHHEFMKEVKLYFSNIGVEVPIGGLDLEVGWSYTSKEAADKGDKTGGRPIRLADYILYRYCLKYSHVANSEEDVDASPKIEFYISDPQAEEKKMFERSTLNRKAMRYSLELASDKAMLDNILTMYDMNPSFMSDEAKIVFIDEKTTPLTPEQDPDNEKIKKFISFYEDKRLTRKAFIMRAMNMGILRRVENTDTIMYGDAQRLGTSMDATVEFFTNEANAKLVAEIEAKVDFDKSRQRGNTDVTGKTEVKPGTETKTKVA